MPLTPEPNETLALNKTFNILFLHKLIPSIYFIYSWDNVSTQVTQLNNKIAEQNTFVYLYIYNYDLAKVSD